MAPRPKRRAKKAKRKPPPPAAYTVPEFCDAHRISLGNVLQREEKLAAVRP